MAGEQLSDQEWLTAKIQQEGLLQFEYDYCQSILNWPPGKTFTPIIPISDFRRQYPLKLKKLED